MGSGNRVTLDGATLAWAARLRWLLPEFGKNALGPGDVRLLRDLAGLVVERKPSARLYGPMPRRDGERRRLRIREGVARELAVFVTVQNALELLIPRPSAQHQMLCDSLAVIALCGYVDEMTGASSLDMLQDRLRDVAAAPTWAESVFPDLWRVRSCVVASLQRIDGSRRRSDFGRGAAGEEAPPGIAWRAYSAGNLARAVGRRGDAKFWLRCCDRVSVWDDAVEPSVRARLALAALAWEKSDHPLARREVRRALSCAKAADRADLAARAHHDGMVLDVFEGNWEAAWRRGAAAFRGYGPNHPCTPRLLLDLGLFWLRQGFYDRSAELLLIARQELADAGLLLMALGASAWCHAALGDRLSAEAMSSELFRSLPVSRRHEHAFVSDALNYGCRAWLALGEWEPALLAAETAIEQASRRRETDNEREARELAQMAILRSAPAISARSSPRSVDLLSHEVVRTFRAARAA